MNYHEAKKYIQDSEPTLAKHTSLSLPSHSIIGTYIAPVNKKEWLAIYTQVVENHQPNGQVLDDLNLGGENLSAYVAVKMKGDISHMTLETYLTSNLSAK